MKWLIPVVGAVTVWATGLDRPFPELQGPEPSRAEIQLGRRLFLDPILSRDGSLSCASCHRPELAFSDGHAIAVGRAGEKLKRNTPSLYNVGYRKHLFWDQREHSLEDQVLVPLLSEHEMNAAPETLIAKLESDAEYRLLFQRAFPEQRGRISLQKLTRALAAFERSLISNHSRYDKYASGERDALTESEVNGLRLFRSLKTRCFECHPPPTFEIPVAAAIGIPSADEGVGAASGNAALNGFFAVPSLRNVALTAPYMHDGSLKSLEDVVRFYAEGGGRRHDVSPERIDDKIRPFDITDGEIGDLAAFMRTLTDESAWHGDATE